jgi:hypothetical protein
MAPRRESVSRLWAHVELNQPAVPNVTAIPAMAACEIGVTRLLFARRANQFRFTEFVCQA